MSYSYFILEIVKKKKTTLMASLCNFAFIREKRAAGQEKLFGGWHLSQRHFPSCNSLFSGCSWQVTK